MIDCRSFIDELMKIICNKIVFAESAVFKEIVFLIYSDGAQVEYTAS